MKLFLGIDLAWGNVNETGVVALTPAGIVVDAGWTRGLEETVEWIEKHRMMSTDILCFVDAPLVVNNPPSSQRACESEVGQNFSRQWKISANSTNTSSPRLGGVQLRMALASSWAYSDGTAGRTTHGAVLMECYPYTTIVGVPEFGYETTKPLYKRKPKGKSTAMSSADFRLKRATECDELIGRLQNLRDPPIDLRTHEALRALVDEPSPLNDKAYKHREDLLDAAIAAWTASYWYRWGEERCLVLGRRDTNLSSMGLRATIIAPARDVPRC